MRNKEIKTVIILILICVFLGFFVGGLSFLVIESALTVNGCKAILSENLIKNLPNKKTIIVVRRLRLKEDEIEIKGIVIGVKFFAPNKKIVYFRDGKKIIFKNSKMENYRLGSYHIIKVKENNIKFIETIK